MFTHHCAACDRTQLIFSSMVESVTSGPGGAVATFTCWCGAEQASAYSLFVTPAPASPVPVTA